MMSDVVEKPHVLCVYVIFSFYAKEWPIVRGNHLICEMIDGFIRKNVCNFNLINVASICYKYFTILPDGL